MAARGNQMSREKFCCSVCLELLKDPVTPACGHSYCRSCIKDHWDSEEVGGVYSCPQCRETFTPRPELRRNIMLAELVEELKKIGLQAAPADHCAAPADHCAAPADHCAAPADHCAAPADHCAAPADHCAAPADHCAAPADHCAAPADHCAAGPEDVACDVCTGRKVKALKSCLFCLASYCENHLKPHFQSPSFMKHKLVEPCEKLQENICPRHNEVMVMFCRTDQQCICYLCPVDEHKGHDTVSAAAERSERQKELEETRVKIQQRVQDTEGDVKLLQQEADSIRGSADRAAEESDQMFGQMICDLQRRSSEVKRQIRSGQETEERRVKELQEKLEQEIAELKRRDAELEQLALTQDHKKFLQDYTSLPTLGPSTHPSCTRTRPLRYFEDLTAAVSQVRGQIQDILKEGSTKISWTLAHVDVLLPQPEPESRADFLKYSWAIKLDPNTANKYLILSDGNRKVTCVKQEQSYSDHPDRFTGWPQVLSRESLTCRWYWEVEMRGRVGVAVSYKNIRRRGWTEECWFGLNDKSWMLECDGNIFYFYHNNIKTPVSGPAPSRVGVYLDHSAGILSFHRVSDTMTLIHRVRTTFTQPLHAGLHLYSTGSSAEFCKPK